MIDLPSLLLVVVVVGATAANLACQQATAPQTQEGPLVTPEPAQPPEVRSTGEPSGDANLAEPTEPTEPTDPTDPCNPPPHEGDPCPVSAGYCVESWGEPGGRSSALWCRDGRWQREEEENLP